VVTLAVKTARSEAEVRSWGEWWRTLPVTDVDADPDYFLTVVANDSRVLRPHVMRVQAEGEPPVLVAARLVDERFGAKVSGTQVGHLRARALVVAFDGVIGARSRAQRHAVSVAVSDALEAGEADIAVFQKTDRATEWFRDLCRSGPPGSRMQRAPQTCWFTELPGSWEELLARRSAKSRRQIRYDDNRLRRTYGDRMQLRRLDSPENADRLLPDLRSVAAVSYQRGIGVSFLDDPVQSALLGLADDLGWLRAWMLYIDGAPVAFWWGVVHHGVLSIGSPGFDPAYSKDRVGYYTLRRMLEDCANDPEIVQIDYGPGDADYKERFATSSTTTSDVLLFARRPRPMAVRALLAGQDWALGAARSVANRHGGVEDLRRWWRARHVPIVGGEHVGA
jgi:CelD/BcsL family acetyltransferase involved in cellulose biosynthesis